MKKGRQSKVAPSIVEHPRVAHLKVATQKFPTQKTTLSTTTTNLSNSVESTRENIEKEAAANDVVLSVIRVLGTLCVGTAASSNKLAQDHLTCGHNDILDLLIDIIMEGSYKILPNNCRNITTGKMKESIEIRHSYSNVIQIDAACALGCLCLDNRPVSVYCLKKSIEIKF